MFNLDPGKLLVIAVVAIILLGPDRLPQVARQVGAAWRSFNEFRHRMESEVRSSMPDLPPTSEIARLARSPSALLNHLSTLSPEDEEEPDGSFQPPAPPDAKADVDGSGTGAVGADADGSPDPDDSGRAGAEVNGKADVGVNGKVVGAEVNGKIDAPANGATNGSGGATGATGGIAREMAVEPSPPTPRERPPASVAPEVIVPGDPTLN
jgi:TatA/E family protein of Tat protein translocase